MISRPSKIMFLDALNRNILVFFPKNDPCSRSVSILIIFRIFLRLFYLALKSRMIKWFFIHWRLCFWVRWIWIFWSFFRKITVARSESILAYFCVFLPNLKQKYSNDSPSIGGYFLGALNINILVLFLNNGHFSSCSNIFKYLKRYTSIAIILFTLTFITVLTTLTKSKNKNKSNFNKCFDNLYKSHEGLKIIFYM